jgi:hypothetical protein
MVPMNFLDPILPQNREAKLRYLDADYEVLKEGEFVRCAVTGDPIRLDNLLYWDVNQQLPYRSAEVAFEDFLRRAFRESGRGP